MIVVNRYINSQSRMYTYIHIGRSWSYLNHLALVLEILKGDIDLPTPFTIVVGGLRHSVTEFNHRLFPIRSPLIELSEFHINCVVELSFNKRITLKLYFSELRVLLPSLIYYFLPSEFHVQDIPTCFRLQLTI